jgi:hypothetical protein
MLVNEHLSSQGALNEHSRFASQVQKVFFNLDLVHPQPFKLLKDTK